MRTPGHEDELATGFLRTEGLIDDAEAIVSITRGDPSTHAQPDDEVTVHLGRAFDASRVAERHFVATASCGICGKASLDEVEVGATRSRPAPSSSRRSCSRCRCACARRRPCSRRPAGSTPRDCSTRPVP